MAKQMFLPEFFHKSDKSNDISPSENAGHTDIMFTLSSSFILEIPSTVEASESEPTSMHKTTFTGKTNRKLQDSWQKEFSWLLYNASDNKMMRKYLRFFFLRYVYI
jgi:hypothetical protein